jgi:hypothetical protein
MKELWDKLSYEAAALLILLAMYLLTLPVKLWLAS